MLIHHEAEKITIYGIGGVEEFTLYLYHVPRLMFTVLKTLQVT